jgi:hypothetical protein
MMTISNIQFKWKYDSIKATSQEDQVEVYRSVRKKPHISTATLIVGPIAQILPLSAVGGKIRGFLLDHVVV